MSVSIQYIAHGESKTGGYFFEKKLIHKLQNHYKTPVSIARYSKSVKGITGFLKLWFFGFTQANRGCNITVQRLFVPVLLKSIFTKSKVVLVWHHYDKKENRSWFYHLNAKLNITLLNLNLTNTKVVVVSNYWFNWFVNKGVNQNKLLLIPNLFNANKFKEYTAVPKNNKHIYLGQYSDKCSQELFNLAEELKQLGYTCFFTSPQQVKPRLNLKVEIKSLDRITYYQSIASCAYAVMFNSFDEGWNRTAHESVLCGLTLIAKPSGGLTDLVKESGMFLVNNSNEAIHIILSQKRAQVKPSFLASYDEQQRDWYTRSLITFIESDIS